MQGQGGDRSVRDVLISSCRCDVSRQQVMTSVENVVNESHRIDDMMRQRMELLKAHDTLFRYVIVRYALF